SSGGFPRDYPGLRTLAGVGDYTAAAVASIAFGVAVPVLDGNVERVMARRLALADDPKSGASRARLLAAAAALLDPSRPGDSNQALMELGATLCLPQRPRCLLCPLRPGCAAASEGSPELYPRPRRRRLSESRRLLVALVTLPGEPDRVLLFRRSSGEGLLAGTWELPWLEESDEPGSPPPRGLAEKYGGDWRLGPPLAAVRHGITYRDLRVSVCRAERLPGTAEEVRESLDSGWFDAGQRSHLPMSSLVGKVLRACASAAPGEGSDGVSGRRASRSPRRPPG
ncbi:MAG TPA: NUDIX domain-containing protein, partial [Thermoanaerobaculia bacterium]|nr:NUDIX domain-containing protein [Thermoanaerobaculia bacterium]